MLQENKPMFISDKLNNKDIAQKVVTFFNMTYFTSKENYRVTEEFTAMCNGSNGYTDHTTYTVKVSEVSRRGAQQPDSLT